MPWPYITSNQNTHFMFSIRSLSLIHIFRCCLQYKLILRTCIVHTSVQEITVHLNWIFAKYKNMLRTKIHSNFSLELRITRLLHVIPAELSEPYCSSLRHIHRRNQLRANIKHEDFHIISTLLYSFTNFGESSAICVCLNSLSSHISWTCPYLPCLLYTSRCV